MLLILAFLSVDSGLGMPPTSVGRFLSGRNHSTVIHDVERIRSGVANDDRLRQSVNSIKTAVAGASG